MKSYWNCIIESLKICIGGDPIIAVRLAHEVFHEIARCGDIGYAQELAEAWMRILSQFLPEEVRNTHGKRE